MLTKEELDEVKSFGDPIVDKLIEFYEAVMNDPSEEFYASLCLTVKKISADLMTIRGNDDGQYNELELNILNRDDKLFERIMMLFKDSEKIFSSLKKSSSNNPTPTENKITKPSESGLSQDLLF